MMAVGNWQHWPGAAAPPPSGGAWDPSQLSTLAAWYDADAITGLSDGDPVSTWADSSASGWDATASSSDRPTYKASILNSLPVVRFNGTAHHLALGSVDAARNVSGSTVYGVVRTDVNDSVFRAWWVVVGQSLVRIYVNMSVNTRMGGRTLDGDVFKSVTASPNVSANTWVMHGGVFDNAGGTITQFVDAVANGTGNLYSSGTTSDTAASAVMIGSDGTGSASFFDGDIAEIVFVHEALGQTDREKLEGYLAHKWGLAGNLPVSHPYKDSPPTVPAAQATGGTETTAGGYKYHTFTSSGTLTVTSGGDVEYLIVGGGGGGMAFRAGGGGAGGVLTGTSTVTAQSYTITVGSGGAGSAGQSSGSSVNSGADSSALGFTATGGGYGNRAGQNGGSGGSGGGAGFNALGGAGTSGQGNSGGDGSTDSTNRNGGGGGGASSSGANATSSVGGDGGDGIEWPTGSGTYYGGGGGGSSGGGTGGSGGLGGGGDGATGVENGNSGVPNTGGGGGGAYGTEFPGGDGGSGIVIIRYPI